MRSKGLGLAPFYDRARSEMNKASNDYEFRRQFPKTPKQQDDLLKQANERYFKAFKEKELFRDLINKELNNETED